MISVMVMVMVMVMVVFEGFGKHNLALRSGEDGGCDDKVGIILDQYHLHNHHTWIIVTIII